MGSVSEKIRIKQKEEAEARVKARQEELSKAGVNEKDQERDPKLRAAKGELKKAAKRLKAIAERDNHVKKMKEKKAGGEKKKKDKGPKKAAAQEKGSAKKPKKENKPKKAKKA